MPLGLATPRSWGSPGCPTLPPPWRRGRQAEGVQADDGSNLGRQFLLAKIEPDLVLQEPVLFARVFPGIALQAAHLGCTVANSNCKEGI